VVTHQSTRRGSANPLRSRGIEAASRSARRVVLRSDVTEEDDALTEEQGELIAEAQEIAKRKRQNMFNEDGVAYAPWLVDQVDDDAMQAAKALRQMRKKKERDMEEESKGYVSITEATTSELSGLGLKTKYLGDGELELQWGTEDETGNVGFIIEKKLAGGGSATPWTSVRSYKDFAPLNSQGSSGGSYTYIDDESTEGEWVYRVLADETGGRKYSVCQVGVVIQSNSEQLQTKLSLAAAALLMAGVVAGGVLLDPSQG